MMYFLLIAENNEVYGFFPPCMYKDMWTVCSVTYREEYWSSDETEMSI